MDNITVKPSNKKEIKEIIKEVYEFNSMDDIDKQEFDFLHMELNSIEDKRALIVNLIQTLVQWNINLMHFEHIQEFEICADILKVIDLEIADARRVIETYFLLSDADIETLEFVKEDARKIVSNNEQLNEIINKQ